MSPEETAAKSERIEAAFARMERKVSGEPEPQIEHLSDTDGAQESWTSFSAEDTEPELILVPDSQLPTAEDYAGVVGLPSEIDHTDANLESEPELFFLDDEEGAESHPGDDVDAVEAAAATTLTYDSPIAFGTIAEDIETETPAEEVHEVEVPEYTASVSDLVGNDAPVHDSAGSDASVYDAPVSDPAGSDASVYDAPIFDQEAVNRNGHVHNEREADPSVYAAVYADEDEEGTDVYADEDANVYADADVEEGEDAYAAPYAGVDADAVSDAATPVHTDDPEPSDDELDPSDLWESLAAAALAVDSSADRPGRRSVGTAPIDAAPVNTPPVDDAPVDTTPVDTDSIEADTIDADPIDADSIDADSIDADSIDADRAFETHPFFASEPEPFTLDAKKAKPQKKKAQKKDRATRPPKARDRKLSRVYKATVVLACCLLVLVAAVLIIRSFDKPSTPATTPPSPASPTTPASGSGAGQSASIAAATAEANLATATALAGLSSLPSPTTASVTQMVDPYAASLQLYGSLLSRAQIPTAARGQATQVLALVNRDASFLSTIGGLTASQLGAWTHTFYANATDLQTSLIALEKQLPETAASSS
jgi:hypothetical protein